MKAYLAGAIEHAPDMGKAWREEISKFLSEELSHDFYNPHVEEPKILSCDESKKFRSLKKTNIIEFVRIVRKLMRHDLKTINNEIDYMICYWDTYASQGGGTYGELTFAFHNNIPVYMVTSKPTNEISGWILGCTTQIFQDFEELMQFLREGYL